METRNAPVLRYFGRCRVKGCKHRRVIEEASHPSLRRVRGHRDDTLVVLDENGDDWPLYLFGGADWARAMVRAGFVCPDHANRIVTFEPGRFTYDATKVCSAKCTGATGPVCSCSCRGENHGGRFVAVSG